MSQFVIFLGGQQGLSIYISSPNSKFIYILIFKRQKKKGASNEGEKTLLEKVRDMAYHVEDMGCASW